MLSVVLRERPFDLPVMVTRIGVSLTPYGTKPLMKVTAPEKPPTRFTLIVTVFVSVDSIVTADGERLIEKSGVCDDDWTTSVAEALWETPPLVPVTEKVYVPAATAPVERVSVEDDAELSDGGLKLVVTPEGSPLAVRPTVPAKPPLNETLTL